MNRQGFFIIKLIILAAIIVAIFLAIGRITTDDVQDKVDSGKELIDSAQETVDKAKEAQDTVNDALNSVE